MSDTPRNQILIVLSLPRSGTTQLARSLRSYDRLNFLGEIFHNNRQFTASWDGFPEEGLPVLQTVAQSLGGQEPTAPNDIFDTLRADPIATVKALSQGDFGETRIFGFKVFPSHLSLACFERMLKAVPCHVVTMVRAPIDTYISQVKADSMQEWKGVDTTSIRPSLAVEPFLEYWKYRRRFLRATSCAADRFAVRNTTLRYEDLFSDQSTIAAQVASLLDTLQLDAGKAVEQPSLPRQDTAPDRQSKVANWQQFVDTLGPGKAAAMLESFDLTAPIHPLLYNALKIRDRLRGQG